MASKTDLEASADLADRFGFAAVGVCAKGFVPGGVPIGLYESAASR